MKTLGVSSVLLSMFFFSSLCQAQKNGVSGYGQSEIIYTIGSISRDIYIGAGGGVVINDNFQFGIYLRALNRPYKFDLFGPRFPANLDEEHPFSNNPDAISTIANHTETGINVGFNIMPDKPFQITVNGMLGLSTVSFSEITLFENLNDPDNPIFQDDFYTMFGGNSSVEVNLHVKVGGFLKMGIKGGYHFAVINGRTRNGNLLKIPSMFSGPYIGTSLVFGSF
ncbi:MAG: hypothetical protein AB8E82_10460 [Aureispira sp.]